VILIKEQEEIESAFSPIRIYQILKRLNIEVLNDEDRSSVTVIEESEFKKLINKFRLKFNKTIFQCEKNIINETQYGVYSDNVIEKVIPLLLLYEVIEEKETKQSKQSNTQAWRLAKELNDIYSLDGINSRNSISEFWNKVNSEALG
jgi:hypothetical protein